MTRRFRLWPWLLLLALIIAGLTRLHFDVEVLNLLPPDVPAVQGLKLYQQHFANARELILTVRAPDSEQAETTSRVIAEQLRRQTNLINTVTWQPPWLEHPGQTAELIAHLWFNQPPEIFNQLTQRLSVDTLATTLAATREQLATSMSPGDMARLSYDPLGLTQLPEAVTGAAPSFGPGQEMFSSSDGTFRIIFVQAATDLASYRDCLKWLEAIRDNVQMARAQNSISPDVAVNYTGRPAFVAEISSGMEHDITISIIGTSVIIAILFWLAHRRVKPMLWLLTLLALILAATLALGGLIFAAINVVSMGFAAILLGLAVDYAVVHYQEALAHPDLSVPEIRRAIAPSIFWAAVTTITAFLVLNFGGLPGLAQLGSLVGVGVALSACVMIFAFLPPLFPDRRQPRPATATNPTPTHANSPAHASTVNPARVILVFVASTALVLFAVITLLAGFPKMDPTADALRPRRSQAYATLEAVKHQLTQKREPLWLLVRGTNESEVARRLDDAQVVLARAVSNNVLAGVTLPTALWPRPDHQASNRATALHLVAQRDLIHATVLTNGFTETALGLTDGILDTWQRAAATPGVFWPTNDLNRWILEKLVARDATNLYALGLLYPPEKGPIDTAALAQVSAQLPTQDAWLSGWELLGNAILGSVKRNLWKLVLPMVGLVLLSLWLAFRRPTEILLSLTILALSGLLLLAIMHLAGWSWNLLNLMALPLILGTGVDYSIFMQLALRRHHGDLKIAHRSVGRALLLCGATAVSGFGALAFSSNAGMASLGEVCAIGIACNMLISVFLLPVWWHALLGRASSVEGRGPATPGGLSTLDPRPSTASGRLAMPSSLYRAEFWLLGLWLVRILPRRLCIALGHCVAEIYWHVARHRRAVVIENLLPALPNEAAARAKAKALFHQFVIKVVDLWRYEAGLPIQNSFGTATGWDLFARAIEQKRGVLLLTPHLGNWEFGGPWLTQKGVPLQVVTLAEPGQNFTQLRQASRARWNIETLVIGSDPFAFIEIIRRLEGGATIALLIDRPTPSTTVTVNLFGRPFPASSAAAELARASGCVLLPVYIPRDGDVYGAHVLPPIEYDRTALRDPATRQQLTQQIVRAFEPAIQQHLDQWYHFIPIWK